VRGMTAAAVHCSPAQRVSRQTLARRTFGGICPTMNV
jgi:hypothetical protein